MDEPCAAEKYPGSGRGRSRRAAETRKASARPDGASGRRLKRCGGIGRSAAHEGRRNGPGPKRGPPSPVLSRRRDRARRPAPSAAGSGLLRLKGKEDAARRQRSTGAGDGGKRTFFCRGAGRGCPGAGRCGNPEPAWPAKRAGQSVLLQLEAGGKMP